MASTATAGVDRWFIGGGAEHTPESARRQTYAATGGAEGVGGPNDLLVRPLAVPGQGVRVAIGSGLALSRYTGGAAQTYMGTAYREQSLETNPTGSTGGRTDLVVMRVKDPFASGSPWPEPAAAAIADEQYVYFEIIVGVPAGTKTLQSVPGRQNDTGIALAKITFPASTGTVTAAMITDLRKVARPRREIVTFARPRVAADDGWTMYLNNGAAYSVANGGEAFPGGAGVSNGFELDIPTWATRMIIDARWLSVIYAANRDPRGEFWLEYGDEYRAKGWPGKQDYEFATQHFYFNAPGGNNASTDSWFVADNKTIPARLRGKTVYAHFKAGFLYDGGGAQSVMMKATGGLNAHIQFVETNADWEEAF